MMRNLKEKRESIKEEEVWVVWEQEDERYDEEEKDLE